MEISDKLLAQAAWTDYLLSERERVKKCSNEKFSVVHCRDCDLRKFVDKAYNVILNNTLSK